MRRDPIRRSLVWGLAATLLLPIALAVILALGSLLGGLGDAAGSRVCGRIALVVGALWLTAIAATTAVNAVAALDPRHRPPPGRRGDRGGWQGHRGRGPRRRRRLRRDGGRENAPGPGLGDGLPDRPA
jgi:hypothetical protein